MLDIVTDAIAGDACAEPGCAVKLSDAGLALSADVPATNAVTITFCVDELPCDPMANEES